MEFLILGPLEVRVEGRVLPLSGARQRAILAILLLHANRAVASSRLVDDLWAGEPPETAAKTLRVHVSQLRKALRAGSPDGVIVTSGSSYLVTVQSGELDLDRFKTLVRDAGEARARGEIQVAATALQEALTLWRGPPLADFADEPFAQPEIARLEELRLSTLEELTDVHLELGRHAEVVGDLEAFVARHPLREGLRAQLMLALYRSGRQAEALRVYQDTRRKLVEELGIEPGRDLQELERAILQQDPVLDLVQAAAVAPEAARLEAAAAASGRAAPPASTGQVRKVVTVLFSDIVDSTPLGERVDPEVLSRVKTRYFERVREVLERHGGTVEKFIGDAVMAVFGVPLVHEDDALRAARAAVELRDAVDALNAELERDYAVRLSVRTGLNTGEVIAGDSGAGQAFVSGDPVNVAARLEQTAQPGEIVIAEATYRLVRDAVAVEPLDPLALKGKGEPTRAHRLVGLAAAAPSRLRSELVGRERELAELHEVFAAAVDGRACRLVTILGSAGVGKSRLVDEFADSVQGRAGVVRGRCLSYGEGIGFLPVAEAIREAAGLAREDRPAGVPDALARVLTGDEEAERIAAHLARALGAPGASLRPEELFWAARRLFECLARHRPVVLVLEDVHWADVTLLDFVDYLRGWSAGVPILVCCVGRAEVLDGRPEWGRPSAVVVPVMLEPLGRDDSERLLANLLGGAPPAETVVRIAGAAEGNPLFVEEMLRALVDDGVLRRDNGTWRFAGDSARMAIPPTIQALLAARLDRLSAPERAVVQLAAVIGQEFVWAAVTALAPATIRDEIGPSLQALVRRGLVVPVRLGAAGEDAFRFGHALVRDAAYESVSKATRADVHERLGGWLERRAEQQEELIGYHLEQAVRYRRELRPGDPALGELARRAGLRLASAGRSSLWRGDAPAAAGLLTRASALLTEDDMLAFVPTFANALLLNGKLAETDELLTHAVEAAGGSKARGVQARALVLRSHVRFATRPQVALAEARGAVEQALPALAELGDELGLAEARRLEAYIEATLGRYGPATDALEAALRHAERSGDRRELQAALGWLSTALLYGPAPVSDAIRRCGELVHLAGGDPGVGAGVDALLAPLHAMQGRFAEARERSQRSKSLLEDRGLVAPLANARIYAAHVELLAGDALAAEEELRSAHATFEQMGDRINARAAADDLAEALIAQGRHAEAVEWTEVADEEAVQAEAIVGAAWAAARSKALAHVGRLDDAERIALTGVERAAATDSWNSRGDVTLALAEMLRVAGNTTEAGRRAAEALELYRRKGNEIAAARTASFLAQLRAPVTGAASRAGRRARGRGGE